jgi:hypothetical protein
MANLASHWSSVEVFLLGTVLMIFEVRNITEYILDFVTDDTCTAIRSYLQELFGPKNGVCFDVIATLLPGAALVVISSALQIISSSWMLTLTKAVIDDVDYTCEAEKGADDWKPPRMGRTARLIMRISTKPVYSKKQQVVANPVGLEGEKGSTGESDNPTFGSYFNTMAANMNGEGNGSDAGSSFGVINPNQQRQVMQRIASDI